ncbi:MAG: ribosomal RNA small subunit methyltransferase A, partial [Actinobacteria bacterium]
MGGRGRRGGGHHERRRRCGLRDAVVRAQGAGEIRALLERHGVHPKKRLGQNFLADPNVVDRIVRVAAVRGGDRVVEVGAGTGTLTAALVATGATVVAYEVDRGLAPVLAETLAGAGVDLRFGDVSRLRLGDELEGGPWTMVANLPYNVGTGIVLDVLRGSPQVTRLVVMVQREVADRFLAAPGSRIYGLPSVVVAMHGRGRVEFTVPPSVFIPRPPVVSAVVSIDRVAPPARSETAIALAAAAFGQRRKMVRRSLADAVSDSEALLAAA